MKDGTRYDQIPPLVPTQQEKISQTIIDLGVEVDTHQDADAFVRTYTFNDAQLEAFVTSLTEAHKRETEEMLREICNQIESYGDRLIINAVAKKFNIEVK